MSSTILDLGTRWRRVVSFTPREKAPRYPLDMRLGGPQSRPDAVEYRKISRSYQELNPGRPTP
jgi:hypothetical protein